MTFRPLASGRRRWWPSGFAGGGGVGTVEENLGQGGPGMTKRWNELIRCLLLIRLGQELGQGGPLAVAVRDFLDALFAIVR